MKRLILLAMLAALSTALSAEPDKPNVILVMTDDQGYGELSAHGNPILKTPHLDRLRSQSVRFTDFHVAPMCTPTRGQLMTGVDALRNGAMNVSSGRTLLRRELPTMPQIFSAAGYRTGIFGKWHLGDQAPYRPQDRGFETALWFPSSHIGSVPDYWENDYFDDTYWLDGKRTRHKGYTTDIFFAEAIKWMKRQSKDGKPFLCYIPTAAPHGPHFVPPRYREAVHARLEKVRARLPKLGKGRAEQLVRYLAMIENIDDNMGRLEEFLNSSGLRKSTIVLFLTDNGSTFGPSYYNAGMRGGKTTLWEGGHRVPCFIRWPAGGLRKPGDVSGLTQVQDILPTLIELCGIKAPKTTRFDGISLADVLRGKASPPEDRMLVINYSRMPPFKVTYTKGNPSIPRREGAGVLWKRWRLLEDRELYDLASDPEQEKDVASLHPEVVARMRTHLNKWWAGVKDACAEFQPSFIGSEKQNPVTLTACEWADVFIDQQGQVRRGVRKNGVWHLEVARPGTYEFRLHRYPAESGLKLRDPVSQTRVTDGTMPAGPAFPVAKARLRVGKMSVEKTVSDAEASAVFTLKVPAGRTTMQTWLLDTKGQEIAGAYYVTVTFKK